VNKTEVERRVSEIGPSMRSVLAADYAEISRGILAAARRISADQVMGLVRGTSSVDDVWPARCCRWWFTRSNMQTAMYLRRIAGSMWSGILHVSISLILHGQRYYRLHRGKKCITLGTTFNTSSGCVVCAKTNTNALQM